MEIWGNKELLGDALRKQSYHDDSEDEDWDTDIEDSGGTGRNTFDPISDERQRYRTACEDCKVIPVSYFLRNLANQRMSLAHHGIGENGMKAISIALMSDTHLTGLDLRDNGLGNTGATYLCELLWENFYISEINISENNLTHDGIKPICDVLAKSDTIKRLILQGNSLDLKSAVFLGEMIKENTSLKYLDISHNLFEVESGVHLGMAIRDNEHLTELNLSWNHLRQKGANHIARSLLDNITLTKLDLSWNGFCDDGIFVLAESLKENGTLTYLDISSNRISHVGAEHLQKGLEKNDGLVILKVGQNPLQQGTAFIIQGVKDNSSSTLLELDLTDVQVNESFINILEDVHKKIPTLKVYHGGVSGCPIPPAERPKPLKVFRDHIKKNQLRMTDVFSSLDKDKNMSLSVQELVQGLQKTGIPLRMDELNDLVRSLDLNGDGEIDYKELVIGNKTIVQEERSEIKKAKASEERNKQLTKDLPPPQSSTNSPRVSQTPGKKDRDKEFAVLMGSVNSDAGSRPQSRNGKKKVSMNNSVEDGGSRPQSRTKKVSVNSGGSGGGDGRSRPNSSLNTGVNASRPNSSLNSSPLPRSMTTGSRPNSKMKNNSRPSTGMSVQ